MSEEELKRQLLEAAGISVWSQESNPIETGVKITSLAQYLKNKPETEQRAIINEIRISGIEKAIKWL
ncbi:MAG: hypothetical protein K6A76_06045 [Oribacterium sp.]|nr:hypothetical protein [Oribacterium sp.]